MVRRKDPHQKLNGPAGLKTSPKKTPTKHDGSEKLMGRQFPRKVDREAGAGWEKESRKMG